jgi:pimeloyl-ACP methyl ester carboxylesterase
MALVTSAQSGQGNLPSIVGSWEGTLDVGAATLRLVLHIAAAADGTLSAKADSPDQGAYGLPVDTVSFKEGALQFEMKRLAAAYEGKLNAAGAELSGQFKQGPAAFPLVLKRVDKPTALKRPQEPQKPFPYEEIEVSYENKRDGVKLAGTLTAPRGKAPFPAVLLITGSGAQNRNEEIMGHKPFLVLSDYLTRQGFAVLRVDDRGIGGSTGSVANSTSENFAQDVLAGIAFLKGRPEINPKQIGLIGHSEGGLVAPLVAAQSKDVAFIVLLAGPGLPGEEILYLQGALIIKASGGDAAALARQRATQEMMFKALKQESDNTAAEKLMRAEFAKQLATLSEAERKQAEQALEGQIKQVTSPWFRYFLTYDPRTALRQVKCPVLALNGEKDLQVPPDENLKEIAAALKAAGNTDVTTTKLPGLNHLLQTAQTGAPSEYAKIEETIAPAALKAIGDWLQQRTSGQK